MRGGFSGRMGKAARVLGRFACAHICYSRAPSGEPAVCPAAACFLFSLLRFSSYEFTFPTLPHQAPERWTGEKTHPPTVVGNVALSLPQPPRPRRGVTRRLKWGVHCALTRACSTSLDVSFCLCPTHPHVRRWSDPSPAPRFFSVRLQFPSARVNALVLVFIVWYLYNTSRALLGGAHSKIAYGICTTSTCKKLSSPAPRLPVKAVPFTCS